MSYKYTKNEFGKRGRTDDDSDDESEEDCSKNIFKYLMFYIFPSNVGDGRRKVLHNLIKKHGGNFTEVVTNHTTHVLVDESVSCGKICRALSWTTFPPHISVVYINWLSDCVRAEYCLKTSDYQVPNNHKPTYVITCANSATSKNSPDTHYIKTKSQSKLKHSKQPRIVEVIEADMSNIESVEEEESSFDDGVYEGETSCDDEWLYSVPSEALNMIIPPSFTSMDQESKISLSISNSDTPENTGTLKLRLYRHKSSDQGYEYSRYSTVNQTDPISSKLDSSASNSINEENQLKVLELSNMTSKEEKEKTPPCPDETKSGTTESVLIKLQNVNMEHNVVDNNCLNSEILKTTKENDSSKLCTNVATSSMNVVVSSTKENVETNLNISDPSIDTSFSSAIKISNNIHSPDSLELKHSSQENEAFKLSPSSKFDSNKDLSDRSNLAVSPIVTSSSSNIKNTDDNLMERVILTDKSISPSKCGLNSAIESEKGNSCSIADTKEVHVVELDLSCKKPKPGRTESKFLNTNACELYETQDSKISSTTENIESSNLLQKENSSPLPDGNVLKDIGFDKLPSPNDSCESNSVLEAIEVVTNNSSILSEERINNCSTLSEGITSDSSTLSKVITNDPTTLSKVITNESSTHSKVITNDPSTLSKVITNDSSKSLNVEVIVKKLSNINEKDKILASKDLKVGSSVSRDKINNRDNLLPNNSTETLSLTLSLVSELVNRAADTESIRLAKSDCLILPESDDQSTSDTVNSSKNDEINKNVTHDNTFLKAFIDTTDMKSNLQKKVLTTSISEPMEISTPLNMSDSSKSSLESVKEPLVDPKSNTSVLVIDGSNPVANESCSTLHHGALNDSTLSKSVSITKTESESKSNDSKNKVSFNISRKHSPFFSICPDSSDSSTQPIVLLNKLDINSEEKIKALNKINDITKINNLPEFSRKKVCKSVIKKVVSVSDSKVKLVDMQQSGSDPLLKESTKKETSVSNEPNLVSRKKEVKVCSVIVNSLDIKSLCDSSNPAQPSEVASVRKASSNSPTSLKLPSPIPSTETSKPAIVTFDLSMENSPEKILDIPMPLDDSSKRSLIKPSNSSVNSISASSSSSNISSKIDSSTDNSILLQSKLLLNEACIRPQNFNERSEVTHLSKGISDTTLIPKPCQSNESSSNLPEFKVPLQKGILKSQSPDSVSHSVSFNNSICNSILPKKFSPIDLISVKQPTPVSVHENSDIELPDQISNQNNIITSVKPFECTAVLSELPEPMDFATAETNLEATLSNSLNNITDTDFKLQPFVYDHENIMKSPNVLNLSSTTPTNDDPLTLTFNSHLSDTIENKFSLAELTDIKIPKPFISNSTNLVSQSSLNSCSKNNDLDILCDEAIEIDSLISDSSNFNKLNSAEKSSDLITDETLIGISALETFNDELKGFDPTLNVVNNLTENTCASFQTPEPCTSTSVNTSMTVKPSIPISPTPSHENVPVSSTLAHSKRKPTKLFLETPNSRIIRKLQLLHDSFKRIENKWRMHAYEKAIMAVRKSNRPITTIEDVQALGSGIAKRIAENILEIVQTGQLRKINEVCSKQREATIRLYSKVWGIGSKVAENLYKEGHRTIRDLKFKANLSRAHLIALRYFTDLKRQIPRPEAEKILTTILKRIFSPFPYVQCDACSSLRRNKLSTGHIDLLLTLPEGHENDHKILPEIVAKLHQDGYLIDDLIRHEENGAQTKYVGIFKLKTDGAKHRRLDITVCTKDEQACALLKLTGPTYFNKAIRQIAKKRNMILDEHSLRVKVINPDGIQMEKRLDTPNEDAVFQCLGLPFRSPVLRDPDKSK
ncbi:serine-rich adhesin for platelets isoform X2 [Parasteatoda tepidariorum]|uniref:serine-rich adhesin for platelets isoform X2 n=1 Tax=Parasteatoda tepidariorum TaxID=114398 RepID=UPI00077FBB22|nr:uncharacterized threonine-rich GPI-anchored glycoprotein PJ4664.02 isoform X2 [Parasteatoda tepidariorum]